MAKKNPETYVEAVQDLLLVKAPRCDHDYIPLYLEEVRKEKNCTALALDDRRKDFKHFLDTLPPGQWLAYALQGSDRVERISAAQAMARNLRRPEGHRWVLATPEQEKRAVVRPLPPVGAEREALYRAGLAKDEEMYRKLRAKPEEAPEVKEEGNTGATPAAPAKARKDWHGHSMCELIRVLGKQYPEAGVVQVKAVLSKLGLVAADFTCQRQMKLARAGEVPVKDGLGDDAATLQELMSLVQHVQAKPAKGGKAKQKK